MVRHGPRAAALMGATIAGMLGCTGSRPASGELTVAPATNPASPLGTSTGLAPGAPVALPQQAVIPVRVTYLLRALRPSIDSLFPARDSLSTARCATLAGAICHQYVYRRDSMAVRAEQATMSIGTVLHYRARLGVVGGAAVASCGYAPEAMRRADLLMRTTLFWRRDWRIGARDTRLSAALRDPCRVTALGVNATTSMQRLIDRQLAAFAAEADTMIPHAADFRPLADSLWRSFLEPTPLDPLQSLWLLIEPTGVQVTPFVGNGPAIMTDLVLYAQPRVVVGAKPGVRARPLPSLTVGSAPPGFSVPLTVELPFAEVERQATALLRTETAKESVRIDTVQMRAQGDSVVLQLGVSGGLRGQLALVSRPRWDPDARELRLDDLAWNLESRGALSRVKSTLAAPLIGRAVRKATSGGRIALGAQLDAARTELLTLLNGAMAPGVAMGTSVDPVQIISITTSSRALMVRALFTGRSGVWIQ